MKLKVKNMNKKISIITPVFNNEKTIEKCILSVKNQDYNNIEHIIIDGGSTDGTVNIIKKYEKLYNLKWISEKDQGVGDAMNKGFNMASGNIFSWIDSDNFYLDNDFVSKIMKIHNEQIVDIVITNCLSNHEGSKNNFLINPKIPTFNSLLNVGNTLTPECVFFDKDLFFKSGGFNLSFKLLADYDLWLRIFKLNPKCIKINEVSIVYVASDNSLLRRKPIQAWKESFDIGKIHKRKVGAKIIFKIKYLVFLLKYPFLKFIKKHKVLKNFFIKMFR